MTTGASRLSPRSEVADYVVDGIRTALAETGGVISTTGWRVRLIPVDLGVYHYELIYGGTPVVECVLCADDRMADGAWAMARAMAVDAGVQLRRPTRAPWLAVGLSTEALTGRIAGGTLQEAGDLERCVAWALLE